MEIINNVSKTLRDDLSAEINSKILKASEGWKTVEEEIWIGAGNKNVKGAN